jgi:hypothetical protein
METETSAVVLKSKGTTLRAADWLVLTTPILHCKMVAGVPVTMASVHHQRNISKSMLKSVMPKAIALEVNGQTLSIRTPFTL